MHSIQVGLRMQRTFYFFLPRQELLDVLANYNFDYASVISTSVLLVFHPVYLPEFKARDYDEESFNYMGLPKIRPREQETFDYFNINQE